MHKIEAITQQIAGLSLVRHLGKVISLGGGLLHASGLDVFASLGDRVSISANDNRLIHGEIVALSRGDASILAEDRLEGVTIGAQVELMPPPRIFPDNSWIGRVVDPLGRPLDGRPLARGEWARHYCASPPPAADRRRLGGRMSTGLTVFDTLLPLVRGQRIGLFAGSGVGKSSLLSALAKGVEADVIVIAMIGERGRELREFIENTLGPKGMARAVIIAATSDQSPLLRRRCAWAGMSVAEHFRDQGKHVLFLADSITRFAEAHREIALGGGEQASDRGYPPSTSQQIMSLAERAGPGLEGQGDITGVFSVLVPGSDMEEPVADILRGTLDGHVVLDRSIAERGRYPAIDVLRSVSRSLPQAATPLENELIKRARAALGAYAQSETMIKAGLYAAGTDPLLDEAVQIWPALDQMVATESASVNDSFVRLTASLQTPQSGQNFRHGTYQQRAY